MRVLNVLVACEFSATVRDAFRARGHNAWSCDLLPCDKGQNYHIQGDVRGEIFGNLRYWDLLIAHPPCTTLTNAGVRWLYKDGRKANGADPARWDVMREAADFYMFLRDCDIEMKCIENPVMHRYAREIIEPIGRQVVQRWWFGEKTFKATGLELHNLPKLVPTDKLVPPKPGTQEHKEWSWVHRCPPSRGTSGHSRSRYSGATKQ